MSDQIRLTTLANLAGPGNWRLALAHDGPEHRLLWVTRGQGRTLLDGSRRGVGVNNVLFVPSGSLFALDLGRQAIGQAILIPDGTDIRLPAQPQHLRLRDAPVITELSGIFDACQRELSGDRALRHEALEAHCTLLSVWLRRQIAREEHLPPADDAAHRLSRAFCKRVSERLGSGESMADHAESLGVTATHLSRTCKATTGRSAAELLSERMLHAARQMLETTQAPAQDIARYLGFGSAAYFTRFIRAHTGNSPTGLRRASASAGPR